MHSDIAANCRDCALRLEISGEWGGVAKTLREAASEVERLRLRPEELKAIIVASIEANALIGHETAHSQSLRNLLARQGGGE